MVRSNSSSGKGSLDLIAFGLLAAMVVVLAFPLAQGLHEAFFTKSNTASAELQGVK
jgi:hypothetical protein